MKAKPSPAVVGLFVLGAVTLGIVTLLSFGSVNFFSKPQRFVVYFDESIHGLDLGSPVKLRGVRVGRVAATGVRYDAARRKSVVAVVCEFTGSVITDPKGNLFDITDRGQLQTLIDQGLRAQLDILGLATGLLYVELDFLDPQKYPNDSKINDAKYAVVPAVPSAISEYSASISDILAGLRRVDFPAIAQDVRTLVTTANRKLSDLDTKRLSDDFSHAASAVTAVASSPEIKEVLINLNATILDARKLVASIDSQVGAAGPELTKTLQEAHASLVTFNSTIGAARKFLESGDTASQEVLEVLRQLGEAADSVQRLADYLERNPNSLLTGRKH